ncbi:MAG TPA: hypothetical protein VH208_04145, partial [Myxococcaceae bacterium]|nr:hypothetical protein [Myxococcaceae bacterium]
AINPGTQASNGYLARSTLDGRAIKVLASGLSNPGAAGLVIDDAYAYWVDRSQSNIQRVPLTGGNPEVIYTDPGQPSALAVDAQALYWVDANGPGLMKLEPK